MLSSIRGWCASGSAAADFTTTAPCKTGIDWEQIRQLEELASSLHQQRNDHRLSLSRPEDPAPPVAPLATTATFAQAAVHAQQLELQIEVLRREIDYLRGEEKRRLDEIRDRLLVRNAALFASTGTLVRTVAFLEFCTKRAVPQELLDQLSQTSARVHSLHSHLLESPHDVVVDVSDTSASTVATHALILLLLDDVQRRQGLAATSSLPTHLASQSLYGAFAAPVPPPVLLEGGEQRSAAAVTSLPPSPIQSSPPIPLSAGPLAIPAVSTLPSSSAEGGGSTADGSAAAPPSISLTEASARVSPALTDVPTSSTDGVEDDASSRDRAAVSIAAPAEREVVVAAAEVSVPVDRSGEASSNAKPTPIRTPPETPHLVEVSKDPPGEDVRDTGGNRRVKGGVKQAH